MFRLAKRQLRRRISRKTGMNNRALRLEPLEPRIVLSGDGMGELAAVLEAPTWVVAPYALSDTSTCMTVKQVDGQEYRFHNVTLSTYSEWVTVANNPGYYDYANCVTYVDQGLTAETAYTYQVETQATESPAGTESSSEKSVTTMTAMAAAVQHLTNQIRAVETFSNPENPGQIVSQLVKDGYPNPTAANNNTTCEKSGTHGEAAYPGDGRNTPGAFQVDLVNLNGYSGYAPDPEWVEMFAKWEGTAGSAKDASLYDTQIAFSQLTLQEFFNITVDDDGYIEYIEAPAASVFLHDDSLAGAADWVADDNPLIGLHIDGFQQEQLSLYLAVRLPQDAVVGVTDPRTSPTSVLHLSDTLQYQTSKSYMYAIYQKYLNHPEYSADFAKVIALYGSTLQITSSQGTEQFPIFGVEQGDVFWCHLTPGFVLGGAYVSGEVAMIGLLRALVEADESPTHTGTWNAAGTIVTFTLTNPGAATADKIFTVDKTPGNVGATYPSIFHYGAVVSPFGTEYYDQPFDPSKLINMTDKAAWGIESARATTELGYTRLTATEVSGTATKTSGGVYVYSGLEGGGTLTLTGSDDFIIRAPIQCPITTAGYNKTCNSMQKDPVGRLIDVSDFFVNKLDSDNTKLLNSSFYVWWDNSNVSHVVRVNDPTFSFDQIPNSVYLYIAPEAQTAEGLQRMGEAIANWTFGSPGTEFYESARVQLIVKDMLGKPTSADEWAAKFITYSTGTGTIDASQATGKVYIIADPSIQTVLLGSGANTVVSSGINSGRRTFVLNANGVNPAIDLRSGDIIDWSKLSSGLVWGGGTACTYDNNIKVPTAPYLRYSYYAGWTGTLGAETKTFQAMVEADATTGTSDPEKIVENALAPLSETINLASMQSTQTSASLMNFTVVFSEEVTDFDETDVTLSGTAATLSGADIVVTNPSSDHITYHVAVTLEDTAGTGAVIATIAAGVAHDADGFTNLASTSTANTVTYVPNTITGQGKSNVGSTPGGGEPLPGVQVSLTSSTAGFAERTTTTDDDGYYEFENVPDGTYQVTISCPHACLDTGSDTTTVVASSSQTFDADFSMGALKPAYIPNRMMVTSSLPVGSVQWHAVVEEALELGETVSSLSAPLAAAPTSQPEVTQYLVLAPEEKDDQQSVDSSGAQADNEPAETVQAIASVETVVKEEGASVVDTNDMSFESEPEQTNQASTIVVEVASDMPVIEEDDTPVVDMTDVQPEDEPETAVRAVEVTAVTSLNETIVEEDGTPVADVADAIADNEPEETAQATAALVSVSFDETVVEEDEVPLIDAVEVQTDNEPEQATPTAVTPVGISSKKTVVEQNDAPVVQEVEVPSESNPEVTTPNAGGADEVSSVAATVEQDSTPVADSVNLPENNTPEVTTQSAIASVDVPSVSSVVEENVVPAADSPDEQADQQSDSEPVSVTQADVVPVVQEAITRWAQAGLDQQMLDMMQGVVFLVEDLDGMNLGMARGNTIWLDENAAGCGWFVDSTPADDVEFHSTVVAGRLTAIDQQAMGQVDLLTVVAHELGHVVGLEDTQTDGLMASSLEKGLRLVPDAIDAALASF